MRRTFADKVFDAVNITLLSLITLAMIYPLWFVIIASFSDIVKVNAGAVTIWPIGFQTDAYYNVISNNFIWTGYRNSIFYTVSATLYSVAMTLGCSYALSRPAFRGKGVINFFFIFTLYFSGGLIPSYLLMKSLKLIDTVWVMILPSGMGVFNMIITRTFFRTNLPLELYEAAKVDGASEFRFFFTVALPLSGAIIAVMCLYAGVANWNSWFGGLLYINKPSNYPLGLVLRSILIKFEPVEIETAKSMLTEEEVRLKVYRENMAQSMRYALIFISAAPLLIAYPFVQKYFVKGVLIGSVKG